MQDLKLEITNPYESFGEIADAWGLTLKGSDINAANFGIAIQAASGGSNGNYDFFVDHVRITVYHSVGGNSFTATSTGDWNLGATWGNGGDNVEGSGFPGSIDDAGINGGVTVTIPAGFAASCNVLTMNEDQSASNSTLNFAVSSSSLTIG